MRKCFGGVTVIVIQGTAFAAASVALRPVCHLGEFHTFYFFFFLSLFSPPSPPYLFIYLSFFLIPVYLLGIVQGPLFHCMLSPPFPNPPPPLPLHHHHHHHLFLPASFSRRRFSASAEKRGPSHEPFNHGWRGKGREAGKEDRGVGWGGGGEKRRGEAPLNWHFRANLAAAYFELQSNKWTVEGGGL